MRSKSQTDFIKRPDKVKPAHATAAEPAGDIKMSAVILWIAEPLIRTCARNEIQIKSTITLAVIVWNISMMPEDEQEDFQNKIIEHMFPTGGNAEDIASFVYMIDLLLERKKVYFPDIQKVIVEHQITIAGDDIHLDVMSAPVKPL